MHGVEHGTWYAAGVSYKFKVQLTRAEAKIILGLVIGIRLWVGQLLSMGMELGSSDSWGWA